MDQAPEFGLPLVTVDVARDVGRLADHAERRNRVGQLADHLELHRRIGQVLSRGTAADRPPGTAPSHRTGPRPRQRPPDRPELHRRIGQVLSRGRRPPDRPELHRRIGQVITRIGQRPDRPELHRRIGRVLGRAGPPTAWNCTVASDRSSPASASGPTARNCTVASDRSSPASDSSSVASAGSTGRIGLPVADRGRGPDPASAFVPGQCEQPRTQLEGSDRLPSVAAAMTNVSFTAPAAAAES